MENCEQVSWLLLNQTLASNLSSATTARGTNARKTSTGTKTPGLVSLLGRNKPKLEFSAPSYCVRIQRLFLSDFHQMDCSHHFQADFYSDQSHQTPAFIFGELLFAHCLSNSILNAVGLTLVAFPDSSRVNTTWSIECFPYAVPSTVNQVGHAAKGPWV